MCAGRAVSASQNKGRFQHGAVMRQQRVVAPVHDRQAVVGVFGGGLAQRGGKQLIGQLRRQTSETPEGIQTIGHGCLPTDQTGTDAIGDKQSQGDTSSLCAAGGQVGADGRFHVLTPFCIDGIIVAQKRGFVNAAGDNKEKSQHFLLCLLLFATAWIIIEEECHAERIAP